MNIECDFQLEKNLKNVVGKSMVMEAPDIERTIVGKVLSYNSDTGEAIISLNKELIDKILDEKIKEITL